MNQKYMKLTSSMGSKRRNDVNDHIAGGFCITVIDDEFMPMLSYHRGSEEWLWLHSLLATDNIGPPNESLMLLLWTHWRYDDDDYDYDATADPLWSASLRCAWSWRCRYSSLDALPVISLLWFASINYGIESVADYFRATLISVLFIPIPCLLEIL